MHPKKQHIFDIYGKEPTTLDELAESAIAVINHQAIVDESRLVGFGWLIEYGNVSTYHNCPIGFIKNVTSLDQVLGFKGRIWLRYENRPKTFKSSGYLDDTLVYSGTGGAGAYNGPWQEISSKKFHTLGHSDDVVVFGYDCIIFLDDWPILKDYFSKKTTWSRLKDSEFHYNHTYTWSESATAAKDREFLSML